MTTRDFLRWLFEHRAEFELVPMPCQGEQTRYAIRTIDRRFAFGSRACPLMVLTTPCDSVARALALGLPALDIMAAADDGARADYRPEAVPLRRAMLRILAVPR